MKNPLRYQLTEYDCGPTSLLNAVSFLFPRETIPPDLIRNIMMYSLDTFGGDGQPGRQGTSRMAMMFLSHWLDAYGKAGNFPVASVYLEKDEVYVGEESRINDALRRGGVAIVRLYFDVDHYVLFTGDKDGRISVFDPYFCELIPGTTIEPVKDQADTCNRIVPYEYFNRDTPEIYALGPVDKREAILIFNTETMLVEENTVEYFI